LYVGEGVKLGDIATIGQQIFNGLSVASIDMLVGVGVTLVFAVTGIVNFAHGEVMILGSYVAFAVAPKAETGYFLAIALAVALVGALASCSKRLFRFTLDKPVNGFLISLGLCSLSRTA